MQTQPKKPPYVRRAFHDPNGTGIFYQGREIALVMGHEGADWLDRPEREEEEAPTLLVKALKLAPGMTVADIGAGSGYLSFMMAKQVLPGGRVLAVDIQPEMLTIIEQKKRQNGLSNVQVVLGKTDDPKLPEKSCDLQIMVDVYHEFDRPYEMISAMVKAMKIGGRLVFVEYRKEDPNVPIKEVHKMSVAQVKKEMMLFPLRFVENNPILPRQHILIFERVK
jgi:ubiquinone/menaquinone biosynthesis C-methylase UbiE